MNRFCSDRALAQRLDKFETEKPEETELIVKKAEKLHARIKELKLRSWLFDHERSYFHRLLRNTILLIIGFPVFGYGFTFNTLPFFLTDRMVRKKVSDFSFWSMFSLGTGIILFPLFYLLQLLTVSAFLPVFRIGPLMLVSWPFAGKLAFKWYILFRKTVGIGRVLKLK